MAPAQAISTEMSQPNPASAAREPSSGMVVPLRPDEEADLPLPAFCFDRFILYPTERCLERDGQPVRISSRAFDILHTLLDHAGEIVPHRTLIARAWPGLRVEEANLRVHIAALRRVLASGAGSRPCIANVPSRGYAMTSPVRRTSFRNGPLAFETPIPCADAAMPPESLIGRDQDLSHLFHLVRTCRMTTIVGPGGIGKTTVARKLMQQMLGHFQETHFVDLGGALATDDLARFLGASLRRPVLGRSHGLSADAFSGRRMLIVLDTCEHLVEQVAALTDWLLMTAPETHVLLTSRQALRSPQEAVYVLPSPDTPRERLGLSSSQQIFLTSAQAGGLRLEPTADDRCLIESICRRLDGNPLAIGIVARRVATHGLQRTSGLIDNPWWLMTQALNGQQQRHRSIGSMIGWSYDLLDEVERCVLDQVSGMNDAFTVAQAETETSSRAISHGEVALALSRLLEHSLIAATADQAEAAFRVPNLIKLFVRSKSAH